MTLRVGLLISLLLVLAGCQNVTLNQDFDPSRDFARYQNYEWKTPPLLFSPDQSDVRNDLTLQRVQTAVADALLQRGLLPATAQNAQLQVQTSLLRETKQMQVTSGYGSFWHDYWGYAPFVQTRTVDYQLETLQIDLLDGQDGRLVWRGSGQYVLRDERLSPQEKTAAIQNLVRQILSQYPPRSSN